jgi:hypothetical protein
MLMLENEDRSEEFRDSIVGLADEFSSFRWALERYDKGDTES